MDTARNDRTIEDRIQSARPGKPNILNEAIDAIPADHVLFFDPIGHGPKNIRAARQADVHHTNEFVSREVRDSIREQLDRDPT